MIPRRKNEYLLRGIDKEIHHFYARKEMERFAAQHTELYPIYVLYPNGKVLIRKRPSGFDTLAAGDYNPFEGV